jgi:hypothetical protein
VQIELLNRPGRAFDPRTRSDVGMIERGEELRLALKAREAFRIGGKDGGQDLDRDVAMQFGIAAVIRLAHPAFAQLGDDLKGTEARARGEGHRGG